MRVSLLIVLVVFFSGCALKTGKEALVLMSDDQKNIVRVIKGFSSDTTIQEISDKFGEPHNQGVGGINPSWKLMHNGKESRLRAYFITGGLNKIQYMSLDPFWGYSVYYDEQGSRGGT